MSFTAYVDVVESRESAIKVKTRIFISVTICNTHSSSELMDASEIPPIRLHKRSRTTLALHFDSGYLSDSFRCSSNQSCSRSGSEGSQPNSENSVLHDQNIFRWAARRIGLGPSLALRIHEPLDPCVADVNKHNA
jgi:hypothetical protein